MNRIDNALIEFFSTKGIHLEKALWLDLKSETKQFISNRIFSIQQYLISLYYVCSSSIFKNEYRLYRFVFFGQLLNHF